MKVTLLLMTCLLVAPRLHGLELNSGLPALAIREPGELRLVGDDIRYTSWSTTEIKQGRSALIFYLPGRARSEAIIAPLRERLEARAFPEGSFQSISIVDLDAALWGTSGFVLSSMAKNKRKYPRASLIADRDGEASRAWSLQPSTVAVILLDASGRIEYLHEGELSEGEVGKIMELLAREIASATQESLCLPTAEARTSR